VEPLGAIQITTNNKYVLADSELIGPVMAAPIQEADIARLCNIALYLAFNIECFVPLVRYDKPFFVWFRVDNLGRRAAKLLAVCIVCQRILSDCCLAYVYADVGVVADARRESNEIIYSSFLRFVGPANAARARGRKPLPARDQVCRQSSEEPSACQQPMLASKRFFGRSR
jgi:hypothetical protein